MSSSIPENNNYCSMNGNYMGAKEKLSFVNSAVTILYLSLNFSFVGL